jgi:hypothetical protein
MYFSKLTVSNYKSFRTPQTLELRPGFNAVFGRNNAGKTALLEGASLAFASRPHKSRETTPRNGAPKDRTSRAWFDFVVSREELWEVLRTQERVYVPLPQLERYGAAEMSAFCEEVLTHDSYTFHFEFVPPSDLAATRIPSFDSGYAVRTGDEVTALFGYGAPQATRQTLAVAGTGQFVKAKEFGYDIGRVFRTRLYLFRAERRIGRAPVGETDVLAPDASNLAAVLDRLQSNPARFRRLSKLVSQVLPEIHAISVRPVAEGEREILLWFDDPEEEREDLAIPLAEAGTGTGQVIAILYVLLTADTGRVFLLDEPQSFLHPGAIRNLFAIAKTYPQHQFVLTTHSPAVITAAAPSTLHHVQLQERESRITSIDVRQAEELRALLADVGSSLAEVFGAERILWVEGPTEEICFPLILAVFGRPLLGTAIVAVKATGDFERRRELTMDIYKRISAPGLLPAAVGFLFDRENLSDAKLQDLARRKDNTVMLLPRPMYENYLLHADALAVSINASDPGCAKPVTPEEVQQWLDARWSDFRLLPGDVMYESVHAGKLLDRLYADLTEARVEYAKTKHGPELTLWILEHRKEELKELAEFLAKAAGLT